MEPESVSFEVQGLLRRRDEDAKCKIEDKSGSQHHPLLARLREGV
jgi:hypothetical protein